MKLSIERAVLLRSLARVQAVVERRTTIPVLANILLDAREGSIALTATDMDLSVVDRSPAEVVEPGRTTVGAHTLYDIVRKLPEGATVALERSEEGGEVTLRAGRSRFELPTLPPEDFPAMGQEALGHAFAIKAAELRRLLDKTSFAISTEETRYYLNGIYLHEAGRGAEASLRAVATDGHRLARVDAALPEGASGMPGVIVPRKTVAELEKLLEESEAEVSVQLSESRIQFVVEDAVLLSRLIDSTFPDYERVIPIGNDKVLVAATKALKEAVDRVATIATERTRAVKFALEPNRLTVSVISPESGRGMEELEVGYAAENLEIGFNARYIIDMLNEVDGDEVELEMSNPGAPTLVRDTKDPGAVYVLMPLRV